MKLSDHAEEILEAMWIAIEEEQAAFYDPASMQLADDDAGCRELVSKSLVELRHGMLYFRPEGREEGKKTIRRHRLAERLMMDVFNIKGEEGDDKACLFEQGADAQPFGRHAQRHLGDVVRHAAF